ncbi:glycine oxidase ThiO [Trichocoleus desertorum]|nr:glycine oxidase ThiO [Trichocoleus sp. FACHB-46]
MNTTSDVLIIGGGIVGLAIAIELKLRGATVTILSRDFKQAAAHAAAGMLAPQAEGIPLGPMLELCLRSRQLYPNWIRKLEELTGASTGYWPCGILAPVYAAEAERTDLREAAAIARASGTEAQWLDQAVIHQYQAGLGSDVMGGWWFPEDAQVDNRALTQTLWIAAQTLGVSIQDGVSVQAIQQQQRQVVSVQTSVGDWQAKHYVLATGAWSNELLPIPVQPRKGQMLAVQSPDSAAGLPLRRVLFGSDLYIVPRQDGRIIIGATSEEVGFTPNNTPAGVQELLARAIRLYPALQDFALQELWWGFRPATPDELPILGASACTNLLLATGHYRNGILLAPITAQLIADAIAQQPDPLLEHFSWQRFHQTKPSTPPASLAASSTPAALSSSTHVLPRSNSVLTHAVPALAQADITTLDSPLVIAGRSFHSRLMTGTGKYRSIADMQQSVVASGCEIVTVAVRRVQTKAPGHEGLAEALDWSKIWMLPNTAGCKTAEEAIRVARLGREMAKLLGQEDNNFVKLEVIPDTKYLLPDPIGTLEAAEQLVKEGFAVLPYINADPLLAKRLEEVGCATVMPLGSPIGSGQGIKNAANIQIIIENAQVPVVVDAGLGAPSEAAQAMEMGASALLINTAIAEAQNPVAMARAMGLAAEAGRLAYLAGRIPVKSHASASSPLTGTITQ